MGYGMDGITSNVIGGSPVTPLNILASIIMLLIIVILAGYLIYRHRKRQQEAARQ